jgi:hypothetical protein
MSKAHLLDSEIQQYVLEKSTCSEYLIDHITHCEDCQQKAQLYSLLVESINQQNKPVFDFNLSGLVMPQLQPANTKNSFDQALIISLITIATSLGSSVFYLIGNDLIRIVSTITPMVAYLLYTIASFLFLFLFVAMYVEFQRKMKTLHFS